MTLFFTASISLLKSTGVFSNFPTLLKSLYVLFNLSKSNSSRPDFKLAKSVTFAKTNVSIPVEFF